MRIIRLFILIDFIKEKNMFTYSPGKLDRKKATLPNKYAQAGNNFLIDVRHPRLELYEFATVSDWC